MTPVDIDGNKLVWQSNPAHLDGILFEIERFFIRMGLFLAFLTDHAVLLSSGKLAVDSVQAVSFITGLHRDTVPHSFRNPCPATERRVTAHDVGATVAGTPVFVPLTAVPVANERQYIVSKYMVT